MLLYQLEHAPGEQALLELAVRQKRPVPEHIKNAPQLEMGLEYYFEAFREISTERRTPTSPIPASAIRNFCRDYGLDEEMADDVYSHVMGMDDAYLPWAISRQKEIQAKASAEARRKARQESRDKRGQKTWREPTRPGSQD